MSRILAIIDFLPAEKGGRATLLPIGRTGYIMEVASQHFSCWVVNARPEEIGPGNPVQLEVILAAPELAMPLVKEGTTFKLKDYREVARGVVTRVLT